MPPLLPLGDPNADSGSVASGGRFGRVTCPGGDGAGTISTHSSSPGWHDTAGGQACPRPLCAAVSTQMRSLAASHAVVQGANEPSQARSSGQPSSPDWHDRARGQPAPRPLCAAVSIHTRSLYVSHSRVHGANEPSQSMSGGQLPSPGRQDVARGQAAPRPLCVAVSVHVRASYPSHNAVHAVKVPSQSTSSGQSSSPGKQDVAAAHAAPRPLCAALCIHTRSLAASHDSVHGANVPSQLISSGHSSSPGKHAEPVGQAAPRPL